MNKQKSIWKNRYLLSGILISVAVAILIHFPELISLFDRFESRQLFPDMQISEVVSEVLFTFISLLILFAANTAVFHFNKPEVKISRKQVLLSFLFTVVLSTLLAKGFVYLHHALHLPAIESMVHHYLHPFRDFLISCVVTGGCYIIYLVHRQQQVIIENQQLQAENILGQYEVLKNQLNPHMLFNSLNTLQSLTREDTQKAQEYIRELSRVLRYTLQGNEEKTVTLYDEMQFLSAYSFLLKMRYENNLHFVLQIDKSLEAYFLPPMSLQVLIENAVKHNEISDRNPLTIHIYTDDGPVVCVSNAIQPRLTHSSGTGIGLANLAKRYQLLFGQDISITEDINFTVRIPLIRRPL
ncbi:sensor histidine kinase [Bacteroides sp. 519]|uniref:sensor histidine kinase n=1 Tax=Bacteroides sp. 519 TaxID=2302937 RepID=UPI0013D7562D|nr:histidine kinase [Bacteroides sp. 519]NDV59356.1 histidine kinase [Bacteroides sp. 519]